MPDESKIRDLCGQLDDLAPYPMTAPFPVQMLIARYAADVQLHMSRYADSTRRARELGTVPDVSIVPLISASYAAGRALLALHHAAPGVADEVAAQIWMTCGDGETAEVSWDWLGDQAGAVVKLAEQIAEALGGSHRDRALALAARWDAESKALREQFAREVHPALASGHTEANALRDRAAELRALMDAEAPRG